MSTKLSLIRDDLHRIHIAKESLIQSQIQSSSKRKRLADLKSKFRTKWWDRTYDRERYAIFLQRVTLASSSTSPELIRLARDYKSTLEKTRPIRDALRKEVPLLVRSLERMSLIVHFVQEPRLFTSQKCREAAKLSFTFDVSAEPLKLHERHNQMSTYVSQYFQDTLSEMIRMRDQVGDRVQAYERIASECKLLSADLRSRDGRSLKSLMERSSDLSSRGNSLLQSWNDATKKLLPRVNGLRTYYLESELVKFCNTLQRIETNERLVFEDFQDQLGFEPIPRDSDDQARHLVRMKFQLDRAWQSSITSLREAHSVVEVCIRDWTRWKSLSGATSSLRYDGHDVEYVHIQAQKCLNRDKLKLFPQWFSRVSVLLSAKSVPAPPAIPDVLDTSNSVLIWKHVRVQYDENGKDEIVRTDDPARDRLKVLASECDLDRERKWSKCDENNPNELLRLLNMRRTWEACKTKNNIEYYANAATNESSWLPPGIELRENVITFQKNRDEIRVLNARLSRKFAAHSSFSLSFQIKTSEGGTVFSFSPPGIRGTPEPHSMYLTVSSKDGCLCLNVIGVGVSIRGNANVKDGIWHAVSLSLHRKSGRIQICVDGKTDVLEHVEGLVVSEGGVYCSDSDSASWPIRLGSSHITETNVRSYGGIGGLETLYESSFFVGELCSPILSFIETSDCEILSSPCWNLLRFSPVHASLSGNFTFACTIRTRLGGTIMSKGSNTFSWGENMKILYVISSSKYRGTVSFCIGRRGLLRTRRVVNDYEPHHIVLSSNNGVVRIYIDGELDVERSLESAKDEDDWILRLGSGFRGYPSPQSDFHGTLETAKMWNGRVVAFSEILEEVPVVLDQEQNEIVEEKEKYFDPIPVHRVEVKKKTFELAVDVEEEDDSKRMGGFYHPVPLSMYEHGTSHRVYETTSRSGVVSRSPRHEIVRRDWGACLKHDQSDDLSSNKQSSSDRVKPRRGHEVRWRSGSGDAFLARSPTNLSKSYSSSTRSS